MRVPIITALTNDRPRDCLTCSCGSAWFHTQASFALDGTPNAYAPVFTRCVECDAPFDPARRTQ